MCATTIAIVIGMGAPRAEAATPGWREIAPKLGACTYEDTDLFRDRPFSGWIQQYHGTVGKIIEGLLGTPTSRHFVNRRFSAGPAQCQSTAPVPAPPGLSELAVRLEPWKGSADPFTRSDTTPVLLEYLRVYECSLAERSFFLPVEIRNEELERRALLPGGLGANPLWYTDLFRMTFEQLTTIIEEFETARPTLERALSLAGTLNLARHFSDDIECLQRASLDIRNALALSADTAACMPRIWNAKDPLRDPPTCSDGLDNDNDGRTDLDDDNCELPSDMTE
jgi:hypothetical protein